MNYAILMFGTVVLLATAYYFYAGQEYFDPPLRKAE